MTALLDTHVLLCLLDDSPRLGPHTRDWLADQPRVFVSAASLWELAIKRSLGKVKTPEALPQLIEDSGLAWLPIQPHHVWTSQTLQGLPHRDPFDRLLCAQAVTESLTFVTADGALLNASLERQLTLRDATR